MQAGKIVLLALLVVTIGDILLLYAELTRQKTERRETAKQDREMDELKRRVTELEGGGRGG